MIFQCKNCNHHYKGLYKLRRHYLSYLPYYFGPYICVICELSFDLELKLINHIVRKKHTGKERITVILQLKIKEKHILKNLKINISARKTVNLMKKMLNIL